MMTTLDHRSAVGIVALIAILSMVLACSAGSVALRRGNLRPPSFAVHLGPVHLVGRTSAVPLCSYVTSCLLDPSARDSEIYTIWLLERPARPGDAATILRILSLPLNDRP